MISKITELTKENQYYIIINLSLKTPSTNTKNTKAGKIFSAKWNPDRIILPPDPNVFVSYLEKFFKMLETESIMI